jgi:hypothetical protein
MPQFALSLATLTQLPPQSVVPPKQSTPHLPAEQTWPVGHATAQAPQLAASVANETQVLPHAVVPPEHTRAQEPSLQL